MLKYSNCKVNTKIFYLTIKWTWPHHEKKLSVQKEIILSQSLNYDKVVKTHDNCCVLKYIIIIIKW